MSRRHASMCVILQSRSRVELRHCSPCFFWPLPARSSPRLTSRQRRSSGEVFHAIGTVLLAAAPRFRKRGFYSGLLSEQSARERHGRVCGARARANRGARKPRAKLAIFARQFAPFRPFARIVAVAGGGRFCFACRACFARGAGALYPAEGAKLQLKWPNDVLLEGRKLGGVL